MRSAQITLHEILTVFRRRQRFFWIPVVVVTTLSIIGAFMLSNKYESSTTILVQRDEVLNPLISYQMAVAMASEDRLRTFNEIIYSRFTIKKLIDSLGMSGQITSEEDDQVLVNRIQNSIETERRGSDSFRITFTDTDPARAQRATQTLANLFIKTVLQVEGQRNEQAVQFFEKKLDEIRQKFEISQKLVVSRLKSRIDYLPDETRQMYNQVEGFETRINEIDTKFKTYQDALTILKTFPAAIQTETGKQALYDLQRMDIPFAAEFGLLVSRYDDYSRRYTPKYPEVVKLEGQILELLQRAQNAIETELTKLQPKREDYEQRRSQLVDRLKESSVSQRVDEDKETDYSVYKRLYDEMKVKLEQAIMTRDLGSGGENQFMIIDPALLPLKPSKPNRLQLAIAGLALGIFFGLVAIILKEMLDTTVRTPRDIEIYQKPVIAFITDGHQEIQK